MTKTASTPLIMFGLALGCPLDDASIGDPLGDEAGSESGSDTGTGSEDDVDTTTTDDATTTDDTTTDDDTTTTDDTTTDDTTTGNDDLPEQPQNLELSYEQIKQFQFTWTAPALANSYQLLERENPDADYVPVGLPTASTEISLTVPLYMRVNASYIVRACNDYGCTDSEPIDVVGTLETAIGYFKASNTEEEDHFGQFVVLSEDGSTLAVGAWGEDSIAKGIDGDQADNSMSNAGAVYVFVRDPQGAWSQQAYVKASNAGNQDKFGWSMALSGDGNTLAVGARHEYSNATGIDGDESNNDALEAGAAYVFVREQGAWSQQAYIKASNTDADDEFGFSVALSGDGNTLAVGASREDSNASGIDGNQADNSMSDAGAVYVFVRAQGAWSQQAYVKASNTDATDRFGIAMALSGDGNTLAVGAHFEGSNATGINGDESNDSAQSAGAAYVFVREQGVWSQQAYVKASNTDAFDQFGFSIAMSGDGNTLAVGAHIEGSNATGIDGNQADDSIQSSGAAYVFVREQGLWGQQAYVKASNTALGDHFGNMVAVSGDGNTLAVGARSEESNATGIGGDQADNSIPGAGAIYLY
jgi:hypothetical protein